MDSFSPESFPITRICGGVAFRAPNGRSHAKGETCLGADDRPLWVELELLELEELELARVEPGRQHERASEKPRRAHRANAHGRAS